MIPSNRKHSIWAATLSTPPLGSIGVSTKADDPCIGSIISSVIWVQANEDLYPRNAKPQVISSCKLGRRQIGEPKILDGKLTVVFEEMRRGTS